MQKSIGVCSPSSSILDQYWGEVGLRPLEGKGCFLITPQIKLKCKIPLIPHTMIHKTPNRMKMALTWHVWHTPRNFLEASYQPVHSKLILEMAQSINTGPPTITNLRVRKLIINSKI